MNNKIYCKICGVECSKKLNIEIQKGICYHVCTCCFDEVSILNIDQIRKLIKNKNIKKE